MIGQVLLTYYPKNFWALNFFQIFRIHFCIRENGSSPKLANLGDIGIGLEFIGPIFENLIEFIDFDSEIILLYNAGNNCFHFFFIF